MNTSATPSADRPRPELRALGASGLRVSAVGLGCNNLGRAGRATESQEGTDAVVHAAIDAGVTLFDTADVYGSEPGASEQRLGVALREGRREGVVIATKFGMDLQGANGADFGARGSRRYIVRAVEASLRRLQTDWIDLYQLHTADPGTPLDETLAALDDLVTSGKVRYVGHSNLAGWQIAHAEHLGRALGTRFVSSQSHYNLLDRRAEAEVVPACAEFGLGLLPYFPLANGLLTGKYRDGTAPEGSRLSTARQDLAQVGASEQLQRFYAFAAERDLSPAQAAFSWLAAQPVVGSVIAGATRPEQVQENAAAVVELSADDLAALDEIFPPAERVALF